MRSALKLRRNGGGFFVLCVAAIILTGCSAGIPAPSSLAGVGEASPREQTNNALTAKLESVPGVKSAEVTDGYVSGSSAAEAATPTVTVTVIADASTDEILAAAQNVATIALSERWPGTVSLTPDQPVTVDPDTDMLTAPGWSVTVYATDAADDRSIDAILGLREVEAMPGVASVGYVEHWPFVQIDDENNFSDLFDRIRDVPLYSKGATYTLAGEGKHLRIVFVPERSSADFTHEIVTIANTYRSSEVLLEATTYEPQWPELYIAHLSEEEARDVESRLNNSRWATADVSGFALPFVLTTTTPSGPQYTTGNVGNLPDDAGAPTP